MWSFKNLIKVFEKMHKQNEKTIIIISHQERILSIADEIVVISNGQLQEIGTSEVIMPKLLNGTEGCKYYKDMQ